MLVLSCHLFKLVAKLIMYAGGGELTDFHNECLGLLKKWLCSLSSFNPEYGTTLLAANTLLEEVEALGDLVHNTETCGICKADILFSYNKVDSFCLSFHIAVFICQFQILTLIITCILSVLLCVCESGCYMHIHVNKVSKHILFTLCSHSNIQWQTKSKLFASKIKMWHSVIAYTGRLKSRETRKIQHNIKLFILCI